MTASISSEAGLTPITASRPVSRPSMIEAATPLGSSVGWFGWSLTESLPGRPIVSRKALVTWTFLAAVTRSCARMILETAAAISGISPGETLRSVSASVESERSHSRKPPTVREETSAKAS